MDGEFVLEQANRKIAGRRPAEQMPLGQDVYNCLSRLVKNTKKNMDVLSVFNQIAGDEMAEHCRPDSIGAGVLRIKVKPGPYMFHMRNRTDEILKQLQEACPSANIREIRLVCLK
jgi:predicted nucleic acid-binding Zn ribbon protein